MKTWEVIKALSENPRLKFYDSYERVICLSFGKICVDYQGEESILDITEEWQLGE